MDEPIKPTTIRTLGSLAGRFAKPAGGASATGNINTDDQVQLKSSGPLNAEIASLAAAVKSAGAKPIAVDPDQPLYRVKKGDSLTAIAAANLGDASRWAEIAALNADQYPSLKHNPNVIREGWTLQMPAYGDNGDEAPAPAPAKPKAKPQPAATNNDDAPAAEPVVRKRRPAPAANNDDVAAAAGTYLKTAKPKAQSSKVTGLDTETDTRWAVDDAEHSASVTAQKTHVTGADTRTNTHWGDDAPMVEPAKPAKPIKPKVPVSLDGVVLEPGQADRIAKQKTVVTGADTVTDSHWAVNGDEQELTGQKTKIVGADTHTDTVWKRPVAQPGAPAEGPVQEGPRVPVSLKGLNLDSTNAEIESQETAVEEIDTGTDTHWNIDGDQAKVAKQQTNVTGAETITRTRWKVKNGPVPQPAPVDPPKPPKPAPCSEAEAVAWLAKHLDAGGRISRETIATMPAGPGKDALLGHFDALLFGYIDPGQQGWVQLHQGDVAALARALDDGGSIKGFANQLTRRITTERGVGDLNRDGEVNEADLVAYAARLRAGQPYEPAPAPAPAPKPGNKLERMQHDLQVFLDEPGNRNNPDAILELVRDHGQYLEVATPAQKATAVGTLLDGNPGEGRRVAALQILQAAGDRKELLGTLQALDGRRKGLDTLMNRLGDNDQGKDFAKLLLQHDLYANPLVWKHMDDDATVSLCEALGFKHPMVGTADELLALSDEARNHMIKELTGGNVTWTELYMAQWINQHNQIPYRIPDYLTENQRRR